jgi:AcrR family transcriptional regulator
MTDGSERTDKYVLKLMPHISNGGLSPATIETITAWMGISRATFYKHFASKEALVSAIIQVFTAYLEQATTELQQATADYARQFQGVFLQSLTIVRYGTPALRGEIKSAYPNQWEILHDAQRQRAQALQRFYEEGRAAQVFHPVNPRLLILQEESLLPVLLSPAFLLEQGVPVSQLLRDYYDLQKWQVLRAEVSQHLDDRDVLQRIEAFAQKLALHLI